MYIPPRKQRKALLTFGTGDAAKTLAIALPTFVDYADRHGYDLITDIPDFSGRPPSWGKVAQLRRALGSYDFALWIDADAIIVDGSVDIEAVMPPSSYQAFVVMPIGHSGEGGLSPCLGVWALRACDQAKRFLAEVWDQDDLIDHVWWEQAALMRLLGWRMDGFPVRKERDTEWDEGAFELSREWDVIPYYPQTGTSPRIVHYAAATTEIRLIEMGTDLARLQRKRLRYWLGMCVRRFGRLHGIATAVDARLPLWRSP